MNPGRRVYIIGFMGSGKSTAGKRLSAELGWQFIDLDKEIELKAGKTIGEIFSESGEVQFRQLESQTLTGLITNTDTVISTGGGTPCYVGNMDYMLGTGMVVYIKMTPVQLKSRLEGRASARPLIKNLNPSELIQYISNKLSEREEYYLKAPIVVDGINLNMNALSHIIRTGISK
jgi:shikimate kinase